MMIIKLRQPFLSASIETTVLGTSLRAGQLVNRHLVYGDHAPLLYRQRSVELFPLYR